MNFAATTCKSPTGVVISVSKVPVDFSSANSRIVITGVASSKMIQNSALLKNNSVTGIGNASLPRFLISITKLKPMSSVTAAMMT